jgi:Tfp pilus assembly protein PilV
MNPLRAFILIEVLATLLLFAVGVTAIVGMLRYGTRVSMDAQMHTTALIVAQTVINKVLDKTSPSGIRASWARDP